MAVARVTMIFCLISSALIVFPALEGVEGAESFPGTRSDGQRTVMLELFTATWCENCPYADAAADRLLRVIGPERVSVIQYHVTLIDELRINESDARRKLHGDPQLPSLCLDGELKSVGATSYEEALDEYLSLVQESLQNETPVSLGLDFHVAGGSVSLNVSLESSVSLAGENLFLRFALFENLVEADGKIYNYTVRAFNEISIDPATLPATRSMTFMLDASWITENMGAAIFLQADAIGGIYQSTNVMFGEAPVINMDDRTDDPISGNETFSGTCTSGRQLSEAFLKVDDGLWVEVEGTNDWFYIIDTRQLSDGHHTIYARVYDIAGIYSHPDVLSVTVKNEKPIPSLEAALLLAVFLSVALLMSASRRLRV